MGPLLLGALRWGLPKCMYRVTRYMRAGTRFVSLHALDSQALLGWGDTLIHIVMLEGACLECCKQFHCKNCLLGGDLFTSQE